MSELQDKSQSLQDLESATPAGSRLDVLRHGLLVSACDRDGACEIECGQVPPLENCVRHQALAVVAEVEQLVEAARAFIDTMGIHHSDIEGREVPRGFTSGSAEAAVVLYDALARFDRKPA